MKDQARLFLEGKSTEDTVEETPERLARAIASIRRAVTDGFASRQPRLHHLLSTRTCVQIIISLLSPFCHKLVVRDEDDGGVSLEEAPTVIALPLTTTTRRSPSGQHSAVNSRAGSSLNFIRPSQPPSRHVRIESSVAFNAHAEIPSSPLLAKRGTLPPPVSGGLLKKKK